MKSRDETELIYSRKADELSRDWLQRGWEGGSVMKRFYIVRGEQVTWMDAFVKTHQAIGLKICAFRCM